MDTTSTNTHTPRTHTYTYSTHTYTHATTLRDDLFLHPSLLPRCSGARQGTSTNDFYNWRVTWRGGSFRSQTPSRIVTISFAMSTSNTHTTYPRVTSSRSSRGVDSDSCTSSDEEVLEPSPRWRPAAVAEGVVSPDVGPDELALGSTRSVFHPTHANDEHDMRLMSPADVAKY